MATFGVTRVSSRTISLWDISVNLVGLGITIGGSILGLLRKLPPSLAASLCASGVALLAFSVFSFWHSRKLQIIDKDETLRVLKALAEGASKTVYLFRVHHLFTGELDEFYEALGKSLISNPNLIVHRVILLRDCNEATRAHLWKLVSLFEQKPMCEIRFAYDAAIGFNMALIDDTVVVGIPDDGGTEFSGSVVVRDPEPVRLLRSAFQQFFWSSRCERWFEGAREIPRTELELTLNNAVEKAQAVSRLIDKPYKAANKRSG